MTDKIITVKDLSKRFKRKQAKLFQKSTVNLKVALNQVSFDIDGGEKVGLVGLNGSGKSTLIKVLLGILQGSEGAVRVFGGDPLHNRQRNAKKIGVVFGQRSQLRWDLPGRDTFLLNKEIYQIADADYTARLAELVALLGAEAIIDQPVRTLSLGERMKLEIISELLHDPQVIILDEPTVGLDVITRKRIIDFLKDLKGKTLIFTSHELDDVVEVCERVLVLKEGELLLDAPMSEIRQIDAPQTIVLEITANDAAKTLLLELGFSQTTPSTWEKVAISSEAQAPLVAVTQGLHFDAVEVVSRKLAYLLETMGSQQEAGER